MKLNTISIILLYIPLSATLTDLSAALEPRRVTDVLRNLEHSQHGICEAAGNAAWFSNEEGECEANSADSSLKERAVRLARESNLLRRESSLEIIPYIDVLRMQNFTKPRNAQEWLKLSRLQAAAKARYGALP
jgi:hypothetical protein